MPGIFSVPERMPRSWPPPSIVAKLNARVTTTNIQSADALGSVNLVAADGQKVDVVLLDVDGNFPTAWTPSTAKKIPCSLAILPISAMGLIDANFVIGVHDSDQDRLSA